MKMKKMTIPAKREMTLDNPEVRGRIERLCLLMGTKAALSRKVGVSSQTLSGWLNRKKKIPIAQLRRIALRLPCDPKWLILGEGEPPNLADFAPMVKLNQTATSRAILVQFDEDMSDTGILRLVGSLRRLKGISSVMTQDTLGSEGLSESGFPAVVKAWTALNGRRREPGEVRRITVEVSEADAPLATRDTSALDDLLSRVDAKRKVSEARRVRRSRAKLDLLNAPIPEPPPPSPPPKCILVKKPQ
jgi:transcriptional regulator with XRE-family HTH domain